MSTTTPMLRAPTAATAFVRPSHVGWFAPVAAAHRTGRPASLGGLLRPPAPSLTPQPPAPHFVAPVQGPAEARSTGSTATVPPIPRGDHPRTGQAPSPTVPSGSPPSPPDSTPSDTGARRAPRPTASTRVLPPSTHPPRSPTTLSRPQASGPTASAPAPALPSSAPVLPTVPPLQRRRPTNPRHSTTAQVLAAPGLPVAPPQQRPSPTSALHLPPAQALAAHHAPAPSASITASPEAPESDPAPAPKVVSPSTASTPAPAEPPPMRPADLPVPTAQLATVTATPALGENTHQHAVLSQTVHVSIGRLEIRRASPDTAPEALRTLRSPTLDSYAQQRKEWRR